MTRFAFVIAATLLFAAPCSASTMHVLLVVDTYAKNATALGVPVDGRAMLGLFEEAKSKPWGRQIAIDVIAGDNVSVANITRHFKNLRCDDDDIVVFYFSGHGGAYLSSESGENPWNGDTHYLALSGNGNGEVIFRKDIRKMVVKSGPRLALIITDCCANFVDIRSAAEAKGVTRSDSGRSGRDAIVETGGMASDTLNEKVFKDLFFKHRGMLDLNGCQTAGFSRGNKTGSYMTTALVDVFRGRNYEVHSGNSDSDPLIFAQWGRAYGYVSDRVMRRTGGVASENSYGLVLQNPSAQFNDPKSVQWTKYYGLMPEPVFSEDDLQRFKRREQEMLERRIQLERESNRR